MKVNPHNTATVSTPAAGESTGTQGVNHGVDSRSTKLEAVAQDRLELSGLVSNMAGAEAAGLAARAGYVKQIARLYKNGGYEVGSRDISRRLIQDALNNRAVGGVSE